MHLCTSICQKGERARFGLVIVLRELTRALKQASINGCISSRTFFALSWEVFVPLAPAFPLALLPYLFSSRIVNLHL